MTAQVIQVQVYVQSRVNASRQKWCSGLRFPSSSRFYSSVCDPFVSIHLTHVLGHWPPFTKWDRPSIRNIRFTCARFCSTSSHLLLDCLDVCLTAASLARARDISCHPTISKGICILHISLKPLSHPPSSSEFRSSAVRYLQANFNLAFISFHMSELKSFMDGLRPGVFLNFEMVHLCSGTWAEGLDVLRSKANSESQVDDLKGAECTHISYHQQSRILYGGKASWASQYVQGVSIPNPFLVTEDETAGEETNTGTS